MFDKSDLSILERYLCLEQSDDHNLVPLPVRHDGALSACVSEALQVDDTTSGLSI
jgi:hypothetical protein